MKDEKHINNYIEIELIEFSFKNVTVYIAHSVIPTLEFPYTRLMGPGHG
jgi:hypothetical protein